MTQRSPVVLLTLGSLAVTEPAAASGRALPR